jgi:hypothetical protein
MGLPSGLLPSGFRTKALYAPLLFPIRATCPAHLSILDLITRMIFGEEYRAWSSFHIYTTDLKQRNDSQYNFKNLNGSGGVEKILNSPTENNNPTIFTLESELRIEPWTCV